jgi:hypothetical protein
MIIVESDPTEVSKISLNLPSKLFVALGLGNHLYARENSLLETITNTVYTILYVP